MHNPNYRNPYKAAAEIDRAIAILKGQTAEFPAGTYAIASPAEQVMRRLAWGVRG